MLIFSNVLKKKLKAFNIKLIVFQSKLTTSSDMPAISNNLRNYIELVAERNISHRKSAIFWDQVHKFANISMIILSSVATVLLVMEHSIPDYVVPIITGLVTMISSMIGIFKPFEKRNEQLESSRKFKQLMLSLISSESIDDYKKVRSDIQDAMLDEPFMSSVRKLNKKRAVEGMGAKSSESDLEAGARPRKSIQRLPNAFQGKKTIEMSREFNYGALSNGSL